MMTQRFFVSAGSVHTLAASAFSLSVLSLLLRHSHKRLVAVALTMARHQHLNTETHAVAITVGDVEEAVEGGSTMMALLSFHRNGSGNTPTDSKGPEATDRSVPLSGKKENSNRANADDLGSAIGKQMNISEGKEVSSNSASKLAKDPTRPGNKNRPLAKDKLAKKKNGREGQQPPPTRRGQRRRRRRVAAVVSSDDETEEDSDSDSTGSSVSSQASQDSLSMDGLTQDTQTLSESPTDSSSGSDTELNDGNSDEHYFPKANLELAAISDPGLHNLAGVRPQKNGENSASGLAGGAGRKGRSIVLAANFAASSTGGPVPSLQEMNTMDTVSEELTKHGMLHYF